MISKFVKSGLGIGCLLLMFPCLVYGDVPQYFLVQNSGWMQPYFSDKSANFPEIVQRLVGMSCASSDADSAFAVFNQSAKPELSPQTLFQGGCNKIPLRHIVANIHAAHIPGNSQVFANSDYQQALYRGIVRYAKGRSAVFWMVTNNKNSPNNSNKLNSHDAAFYKMLHESPQITRVIAIPLADAATSQYFTSHGLIVFGIAYGAPAASYLQKLVAGGDVAKTFSVPAALLKPLTVSAVSFVPTRVVGPVSRVREESGVLRMDLPAKNHPQSFAITGQFTNHFYPYFIVSADASADILLAGRKYPVPLAPNVLQNVQPNAGSAPVTLRFTLPAMSTWSLATIFGAGKNIPAVLQLQLQNQRLAISPEFVSVIDRILPDAPMPEIFRPDPNVHSSQTDIPIMVRVQYPIWPLLLLLAGLLVLVLAVLFVLYRLAQTGSKAAQIRVNGKVMTVRLARGKTQNVRDENGDMVATIKRGFWGYGLSQVKKGAKIELIKK